MTSRNSSTFCFIIFCISLSFAQIHPAVADNRKWGRGYRQDDPETHNFYNQIRQYEWKKEKKHGFETLTMDRSTERAPNFDWTCIGNSHDFKCGYCQMAILCVAGEAYFQPCPSSFSCTFRPEFNSNVCYPEVAEHCKCSGTKNELKPDPYNPFAYLMCSAGKTLPTRTEVCPSKHEFDAKTSTCKPLPDFPPCMTAGTFPLIANCRWYYTCITNAHGRWRQMIQRCLKEDTVYSSSIPGCTDPSTLPSSDTCSSNIIPVTPTATQKPAAPSSLYICTLFGRVMLFFFPNSYKKFCARINR